MKEAVKLVRGGFKLVPIPQGKKGPTRSGWQTEQAAISSEAEAAKLNGCNLGLAHLWSGTCCIDVDEWTAAEAFLHARGVDLAALFMAPDAVQIHSGRPGRAKLLYSLPAGVRWLPTIQPDSSGLELRCATRDGTATVQDVLPPSLHPITGRPYEWRGEPESVAALPALPAPLLALWRALAQPQERHEQPRRDTNEGQRGATDQRLRDLRAALLSMRADDYHLWVRMGLALHELGDAGRGLWLEWSATSEKFDPADAAKRWDKFNPTGTSCEAVFAEAQRGGWANPAKGAQPEPDAAAPWSVEPLDIYRQPIAPEIPAELFPEVLRHFAVRSAEAAGHDPGAYLMACLAAAAGAIPDGVRILLRPKSDFFQSARLWVALVGPSSSAKTPPINRATGTLYEIHGDLRREYQEKVAALSDDEARSEPVPAVVVSDITIEAMRDTLKDNPQGVIAIYEEFDSWIGSHDAYRGNGGSKDRGEWLRLYDGGPHTVDRASGPPKHRHVFVPNWGCSILAATTYAALRRHAKNLPPDGLMQRFLIVTVRPLKAWDDSILAASTKLEREAYDQCLRELRRIMPCTVRLAAEAIGILNARQAEIAGAVDAVETISADLAAHLGKHVGMLGRVALTLHCLEHREAAGLHEVSGETMRASDQLLRLLLKHAACMYGQIGRGNDAADLAKAVGASIIAGGSPVTSRTELNRGCRAFRDAAEPARDAAMRYLEDAAWLTPVMDRQYGGRPALYTVNPLVHDRFADAGVTLKARRAAVREVFS